MYGFAYGTNSEYVIMTMTGAPLEDDETYQIAFAANSYTEEVGKTYNVRVVKAEEFLRACVRIWLEEQRTASPDGNPWE